MIADSQYKVLKYLQPIHPGMECEKIDSVIGDPWYYCPTSPNQGCIETFERINYPGFDYGQWKLVCNNEEVMAYTFSFAIDNGRLKHLEAIVESKEIDGSNIFNSPVYYYSHYLKENWYFKTTDEALNEI